MRPSLLLLAAAAGAAAALTAAPRADAADAVYGGGAQHRVQRRPRRQIVVRADPDAKQLRSIGISWRAGCADGMGFPGFSQLTPAQPVAGFVCRAPSSPRVPPGGSTRS